MTELYWITRLDAIIVIMVTLLLASICGAFLGLLLRIGTDRKEDKDYVKGCCLIKRSLFVAIFAILVLAFIPSTNQALMIYGIGGTIDYVKSNDKAKKLPDKCIDALDKYLDNINKQKKK